MLSASRWLEKAIVRAIKGGGFAAYYICLAGSLVLVTLDPVMRYIVGQPFRWSNDVSTLLMVLTAYLAFAVVFAKGRHIRVTFISDTLPVRVRNGMWAAIGVMSLLYLGLVTYALARETAGSITYHVTTYKGGFAEYPWLMAATAGMVLLWLAMAVFTTKSIVGIVKHPDVSQEKSGKILDGF